MSVYVTARPRDVAVVVAIGLGATAALASRPASAMPAFARREELACGVCHQAHFPRLNAFGRQYQENGYQLPDGAAGPVRDRADATTGLAASVPLSVRGQVFALVPVDASDEATSSVQPSLGSYVMGGGTVARNVSYVFSGSVFPAPVLHHAHIGAHNLLADRLGEGTLNVRAGSLFLMDFARPGHRDLFASPAVSMTTTVGRNTFNLDDANLGAQVYGRPGFGPFHYEVAVVAGDLAGTPDRDDGKDVFARTSVTLFQHTDHELTGALFGYRGRSDIVTTTPNLVLAQRDVFWLAGGDAELDLGHVDFNGLVYASRHSDAALDGAPVQFEAWRGELVLALSPQWSGSVRYEGVASADDPDLGAQQLSAHAAFAAAPNALVLAGWRQDLSSFSKSSAVVALDVAF